MLSLGLSIRAVYFGNDVPNLFLTKPDVAVELDSAVTAFDATTAQLAADFVLRYESQTGMKIDAYSYGDTYLSLGSNQNKLDTRPHDQLNDESAESALRSLMKLDDDKARQFVSIKITTYSLSKTKRQIALIKIEDTSEAIQWLAEFGKEIDPDSPQRVLVQHLGEVAELNTREDIEIAFAGISVPRPGEKNPFAYFKAYYPPHDGEIVMTNDPHYFPPGPKQLPEPTTAP